VDVSKDAVIKADSLVAELDRLQDMIREYEQERESLVVTHSITLSTLQSKCDELQQEVMIILLHIVNIQDAL
jgi:broad specificity phosphatase PhoE